MSSVGLNFSAFAHNPRSLLRPWTRQEPE
jgi:hypothetical protein